MCGGGTEALGGTENIENEVHRTIIIIERCGVYNDDHEDGDYNTDDEDDGNDGDERDRRRRLR